MTEDTKMSPLSEALASITIIGGEIRWHVGVVAVNSSGRGVYVATQKILSL